MVKVAFITGITGQDGSYLSELLLEKGYIIYGLMRRSSNINTIRIDHIFDKLNMRYGDLSDSTSISKILNEIKHILELDQLEIYNLGAMSHVAVSFKMPEYSSDINAIGTLRILDCVVSLGLQKITRFYQASTSELYGKVLEIPQTEKTPFNPQSPYAIAKLYSFYIVKNYRDSYNLFACNGILFNHESPRRGDTFVTKKITNALKNIITGNQEYLILGNLDSKRDWGHARDYVIGMWLMLQQSIPDDYILATNEMHSVREFVEEAFRLHGINILWKGYGLNEVGYCDVTGKEYIKVSEKYFRPSEVELLLGDASKAKDKLNWTSTVSFKDLVSEMVLG